MVSISKRKWFVGFVIAYIFLAFLQAASAFAFVYGLSIPKPVSSVLLVLFGAAILQLPYLFWLASTARQPSRQVAFWLVRPLFAWHFNWSISLLVLGPVILLGSLGSALLSMPVIFETTKWIVLCFLTLWWVLALVGLLGNIRAPEVTETEIEIQGMGKGFDGLRIAHISDIHVAWWSAKEETRRVADLILAANPDILLITGDMVDHNPDYVNVFADAFAAVQPRLGRYAIIGNHDAYTGRNRVARRMEDRGFRMLRNEWVTLEQNGSRIVLAGMDDSAAGWISRDKASAQIGNMLVGCPEGVPVILLAHRPPDFNDIADLPIALTLSGHTHGGQLRLPFGGPGFADITFEHVQGVYSKGPRTLYVSRGIGTVGFPYRLFCRSEISMIVLRSSENEIR